MWSLELEIYDWRQIVKTDNEKKCTVDNVEKYKMEKKGGGLCQKKMEYMN